MSDSDDDSDDDVVVAVVLVLEGVMSAVSERLLIFACRYSSSCLDGITVFVTLSFSVETTYKIPIITKHFIIYTDFYVTIIVIKSGYFLHSLYFHISILTRKQEVRLFKSILRI